MTVLRFIVKYWIWNSVRDGEYGSGIFELKYGSNYGRDTVGYTGYDMWAFSRNSTRRELFHVSIVIEGR